MRDPNQIYVHCKPPGNSIVLSIGDLASIELDKQNATSLIETIMEHLNIGSRYKDDRTRTDWRSGTFQEAAMPRRHEMGD